MPVELDYWARKLNRNYKQEQVERSYTLKADIPKQGTFKPERKFSVFKDD